MEIKFLKAGSGDSILIHHKTRNILVDGGNNSKFLLAQMDQIRDKGELLDLLVITHHDDDHIKGIIDFLERIDEGHYGDKTKFIKQVIFNSPRLIKGKLPIADSKSLSYKQAYEVEKLLLSIGQNWTIYSDQSAPIFFEDLKLSFLSPTIEDIAEYGDNRGAYLAGDYKCDWSSAMHILDKYIDDKSQDESVSNKSSVVVVVECEGKKILLTGDVTPNRFEQIIAKLVRENDNKVVDFDYIKCPHHGSYRSLNKKIIENIRCSNYVISSDSSRNFLPNKRTLLKVLKYSNRAKNERVNFFFNYSEALAKLLVTEKELKDYNFTLVPNNQQYGFVI